MDLWTHIKTMLIFSVLKWIFLKSYMDTYVLNQWTHGLSDTQQNNTSLFNVGYFSKSFIHMSIEISGHMDLWTHGLSDTQQKIYPCSRLKDALLISKLISSKTKFVGVRVNLLRCKGTHDYVYIANCCNTHSWPQFLQVLLI